MVHHGSHVELQYQLSTYGIPLDTFPVDANGNVRDSILNAWFYEHLEKHGGIKRLDTCPSGSGQDDGDEADNDASFVSGLSSQEDSDGASHRNHAVPNTVVDGIWETDVLLGRGRLVQYHAGNINFRDFLDERSEGYEVLPRSERRIACANLTRELLSNGTRFLKHTDDGLWVVCGFDDIVDKVAQYYRTRRRSVK